MTPAMLAAVHRLPWQARRGHRGLWWALAGLAGLALLQAWRYELAPVQLAGALCTIGALWWWWLLVDGVTTQNRPALARLLPGQARSLRITLLAHAALSGALAWGGLTLLAGPQAETAGWVLLGLLVVAWTERRPWLWLPVALLPVSPWSLRAGVLQVTAWPAAAQLVVLAAAALLLAAAVGGGGPMHRRLHARHLRWDDASRASKEGRGVPATARHAWLRWAVRPFTWPDPAARRWLLARPTAGNVLHRVDLALQTGGGTPMLAWLLLLCFGGALLALAVARTVLPAVAWDSIVDGGRFGLCMGLFGVLAGAEMGRQGALWGRRREQALLVLLPGPPSGPALASGLERLWHRESLALWLLGTALVLAIAAQGQAGNVSFVAGFAAALLPLSTWLRGRWHRLQGAPATALPAAIVVALGFSAAAGTQALAVPAAASLAVGVALHLAVRWRLGSPARALLPAGRAAAPSAAA